MAKVKLTRSTLKFFQGLTAIKYKIKRKFEPRKKYVKIENIHYGTDKRQVFDLYYTNTEKKNILLINIHGGFYVGSSRKDNFMLAHYFLRKGIDVALIEYRLNDNNIETKDEMQDVNDAISFIYNNLDLLRLTHDKIFIMGDSAGGHFALMNALAKCTQTPLLKDDYKICGVMLNCPAYNYQDYHSYDELSNGLKRWILGKNYKNPQYLATLSCKSYISNLKLPIFISTSTLDFLRKDVLDLISDLDKYKINYTFVDIKSNNHFAGHVHNVMRPRLKESIKVNKAMYEFMLENVEKERGINMPIFEEQVVKASRYIKYVKKDDKIIAFRIKYPFMQTLLYIIITLASVAGAIVTAVYLNKKMLELYIAFFIFIACLVVFLTFASLVVRNQFKLICENEAFILKQPFKPEKVLPCRNVEQVDITKFYSNRRGLRYLIIFWSRDGQRYFYFYNNGFLLKKDVLTKLLDTYQIPYKIHK